MTWPDSVPATQAAQVVTPTPTALPVTLSRAASAQSEDAAAPAASAAAIAPPPSPVSSADVVDGHPEPEPEQPAEDEDELSLESTATSEKADEEAAAEEATHPTLKAELDDGEAEASAEPEAKPEPEPERILPAAAVLSDAQTFAAPIRVRVEVKGVLATPVAAATTPEPDEEPAAVRPQGLEPELAEAPELDRELAERATSFAPAPDATVEAPTEVPVEAEATTAADQVATEAPAQAEAEATASPAARAARAAHEDLAEAPTPLPALETCEIAVWQGYLKARFYARVLDPDEGELAVAESTSFRSRGNGTLEQTEDAVAAHKQLVDYLARQGWTVQSEASPWYASKLARADSA